MHDIVYAFLGIYSGNEELAGHEQLTQCLGPELPAMYEYFQPVTSMLARLGLVGGPGQHRCELHSIGHSFPSARLAPLYVPLTHNSLPAPGQSLSLHSLGWPTKSPAVTPHVARWG